MQVKKYLFCYKLCAYIFFWFFSLGVTASIINPDMQIVEVDNLPITQRSLPSDNDFTPFDGMIRPVGHKFEQAYWVKILDSQATIYGPDGLFVVNPITMNSMDLYIPEISPDQPIKTITRYDVDLNPKYSRRSTIFEMPVNFQPGMQIYFYVQTALPQLLSVEYMHRDEYQSIDNSHIMLYYTIFGGLLILIITNFFYYLGSKNKEYLYYVFYLSTFLFLLLNTTGEIYQLKIAHIVSNTYPKFFLSYFLLTVTAILFTRHYLQIFSLSKRADKILVLFAMTFSFMGVICLLFEFVPPGFVLLFQYMIVGLMVFLTYLSIRSVRSGNPRAIYFFIAFLPLFFMALLRILATNGTIPVNRFTINGFQVAIVFQALVLSIGLAYDIYSSLKERERVSSFRGSASTVINIEKEFSQFIALFSESFTQENFRSNEDEIATSFFKRIKKLYALETTVFLYRDEFNSGFYTDSELSQTEYEERFSVHLQELGNIFKGDDVQEVSSLLAVPDDKYQHFAIPIYCPGLKWCGLLISVPHFRKVSTDTFKQIHRFTTEMVRTFQHFFQLSISGESDQLTKLMSRIGILETLERYQNLEPKLTIVLFNISNLKKINQSFGYQTGDSCLLYMTYLMKKTLDKKVKIGRVSSSQFMLIFRNQELPSVDRYVQSFYAQLTELTVDRGICVLEIEHSIIESISPHDLADSILANAEFSLRLPKHRINKLFNT